MKRKRTVGIILLAVFCLFTYLVKTVDVQAIGPDGTSVGFASLNGKIHSLMGLNMKWYDITGLLGYAAIAAAAICAASGLVQLIRRKSILKVDREILALGILFVIVIGLYVCFEKVIINYRPEIMPGETAVEASYPSSHTMLVCSVMGGIAMLIGNYRWNEVVKVFLRGVCCIMIAVMVCGRLYSGVHWFTDIVGGLILSASLLSFYAAAVSKESAGGRAGDPAGYKPKH